MTPEIRGKMISQGVGMAAFLAAFGTNHFIGKEHRDPHRLMCQLRRMPAEKAFDKSSCILRSYPNGPRKEEFVSGDAICRWWRWPHRRRQPIDFGYIPTADEHLQRWIRLGWKQSGFKFRGGHKSRWRKKPHQEHHSRYWIDTLQDVCETLTRRSGRLLSDESRDMHITRGPTNYEKMRETTDENIGVFTEIFSQVGMRSFTSFDKAHWQPGEPVQVSKAEIADFEQTARQLRARAPKALKPSKAYTTARYWNDRHYPPPRRVALVGRCTIAAYRGGAPSLSSVGGAARRVLTAATRSGYGLRWTAYTRLESAAVRGRR
jgi:hypothetical protein